MKMNTRFSAAALLCACMSVPALADTVPATQSTGQFELIVRVVPPVTPAVTIIGLDDIPLGTFQRVAGEALENQIIGHDDFCINTGWTGSTATYPGPLSMTVYQVGGGVSGRYALRGRSDPSKSLPVTLTIVGGRIGAESRPGGAITTDGSTLQMAPSFASCTAASTNLTFNAARITVTPDGVPADSDMADGALSAIFAIVVSAP